MKIYLLSAAALLCFMPHYAYADDAGKAAAEAFKQADHKMMEGMHITPTGDADRDFVLMMIPHHQGAIDMAKVELQYGKDPELRKLAEEIIAAQDKEIAQMNKWLEDHSTPQK